MSFERISLRQRTFEFNKSLTTNENYRKQMKALIKNVLDNLDQGNVEDPEI